MTGAPPLVALWLFGTALASCTSQAQMASALQQAATNEHMPRVVACWESEFEKNGFAGEYLVTVNFEVTASGNVRHAHVADAVDVTGGDHQPLSDGSSFADCVESALDATSLAPAGMTGPLTVKGYRIAFSDPSRDQRRAAQENAPSLLVGPRADRCQGLYTHDPPRDAGLLHKLLGQARASAAGHKKNRDKLARAWQRSFDLALELHERLTRDARQRKATAGKERLLHELRRVAKVRDEIGRLIQCERPR